MKKAVIIIVLFMSVTLVVLFFLRNYEKENEITFIPYKTYPNIKTDSFFKGNYIVETNPLRIVDIETGKDEFYFSDINKRYEISDVSISPDNNFVVAVGGSCAGTTCIGEGRIFLFDLNKKELLRTIKQKTVIEKEHGFFTKITFTSDSKYFVTGQIGGAIKIWETNGDKPLKIMGDFSCEIWNLMVLDDKYIISGDDEGFISKWDLASGEKISSLQADRNFGKYALSNEKELIAVQSRNRIELIDLKNNNKVINFLTLKGDAELRSMSFSKNGNILALSRQNGSIDLINLENNKSYNFFAHESYTNDVEFSEDDKFIFSNGDDGAKIWKYEDVESFLFN